MKMIPYTKRYVILIEVIIAMTLTMGIMSLLLIFYKDISHTTLQQEKEDEANFQQLYLATRLAAVLPKAVAYGHPDKDYFFFTSSHPSSTASASLIFAFDNGVKLNPDLSNHVIGCLHINSRSQLCLSICPSPLRWKEFEPLLLENEVLFENVADMRLEFYVPPAKERHIILANNKAKIEADTTLNLDFQGSWRQEWQQEYGDLPALIRIMLKPTDEKQKLITLHYSLPNSHFIIVYDR